MHATLKTLTPEMLERIDAYWRAANYLSVGQIYLYDNPLLKRPLAIADVKHMLLGKLHLRAFKSCHQKV
jgi:xylulose-5-phosphate/fructose-6-phosphate phosphoketolase